MTSYQYQGFSWVPPRENSSQFSLMPKNKYIFLKQQNDIPRPTVLVNPHFKDNKKVYINPKFSANKMVNTIQPCIHVNPNVIKSSKPISSLTSSVPPLKVPNDSKPPFFKNNNNILLLTKTKLIKTDVNVKPKSNYSLSNVQNKFTSTPVKKFIKNEPLKTKKIVSTRTKIVNVPIQNNFKLNSSRRNSIGTKFKYISSRIMKKVNTIRSNHKIVNNISKIVKYTQSPNTRKKYIFVNKFNSSSILAKSVILKNIKRKSLVNVNGIFYQNPHSMVKKVNMDSHSKSLCRRSLNQSLKNTPKLTRMKQYKGKYKLERAQIPSARKMKKSNVPCLIYKKFGKCKGQKNGTCIKKHNPDQIELCTRFLQGECIKKNCLLSHKVSAEKMPTCRYFLEGLCSRDDCQYLHVKISPKADICKDFLEGFCKDGVKCEKRHQFLCPDFEKNKTCPKRNCKYPHKTFRKSLKKEQKIIYPHCEKNKVKMDDKGDKFKVRYYDEEREDEEEESEEKQFSKRPKLGVLPSFIPLLNESR